MYGATLTYLLNGKNQPWFTRPASLEMAPGYRAFIEGPKEASKTTKDKTTSMRHVAYEGGSVKTAGGRCVTLPPVIMVSWKMGVSPILVSFHLG